MHLTESMYLDCTPEVVFPLVAELDRYPGWMRLVHRAEAEAGSDPPAWSCELRAKVGPFARSKRLRMIRSKFEQDRYVAFERAETDGRSHARWAMQVSTTPADRDEVDEGLQSGSARPDPSAEQSSEQGADSDATHKSGTKLVIVLIYGGDLWTGGLLDRILDDEVQRGKAGLQRKIDALTAETST